MKKLLIWCVLLLLPIHVFAVSKTDIDTYHDRYIYSGFDKNGNHWYWDYESAKAISFEDPIYKMEANLCVLREEGTETYVLENTIVLDFDYNRSKEILRKEAVNRFIQKHGSLWMDAPVDNMARMEQKMDTGIRGRLKHVKLFDENGRMLGEKYGDVDMGMFVPVPERFFSLDVINSMFYKCYGFNFLYLGL